MRRLSCTSLVVVVATLAVIKPWAAGAQGITRDNYRDYLPPLPRIVGQTRATAALHLYGDEQDPAYRDVAPVDGIDDTRARRLLVLAEQFSPLLRRNNFSVPRDLATILGPHPALHVDSWVGNHRIASDSIALGAPADSGDGDALLHLMRQLHPRAPRPAFVRPEGQIETVLFFDMPGHEPATWRAHFRRLDPARGSRIFVHPFIHDDSIAGRAIDGADRRFQLVLQFWFFYPFNDAVNTHEGDWEHINVIVATKAAVARAQPREFGRALHTEGEIARILAEHFPPADSLVIAAVDHYFHDSVITLDFVALSASPTPTRAKVSDPRYVWEDLDFVSRAIRMRLTYADGRLATHPIVHVGGNNKGPDELLAVWPRFHGSFKRNSGASYPFPGVWQTVGPMGVTEKVYGAIVPRVHRDSRLAWYALIDDPYYVHYTAAAISLMPDWERVDALALGRRDVRQQWCWLLLPIYWGFPATSSLGAGLVKHVDLGHVAVLSPPYHSTWNSIGESYRHRQFQPRVLRTPVSPTTPWAMLKSGWGVLNIPLAAWGLMPGYNVALIQVMPWTAGAMNLFGSPPARTFTQGRLPRRFTTAGQGAFMEFGGRYFARIVPRRDATVDAFLQTHAGASVDEATARRTDVAGPRLWFNLYFGQRFSLENTFSWATGGVAYDVVTADGATLGSVRGDLYMRQLTGGIRYDLVAIANEALRVYARGGYGWLSYEGRRFRLARSDVDGPLERTTARGGYLPPLLPARHWWPNTVYAGLGSEAFSPQRLWLFGRLGYGMRLEFTELYNKLTFDDERSALGDVTARRGDLAFSLVFGW
jgi:hypothetical protein